jgi:hypothetical protein
MSKSKAVSESGQRVNKSEAIRTALTTYPNMTTREIIAKIAESGIKVTPTMVYFIRSKQKQAGRKDRRDRATESSRLSGARNPIELVARVKELAREVGGIRNLKQLVDLLVE